MGYTPDAPDSFFRRFFRRRSSARSHCRNNGRVISDAGVDCGFQAIRRDLMLLTSAAMAQSGDHPLSV